MAWRKTSSTSYGIVWESKEKDLILQVSYGDISRVWFVDVYHLSDEKNGKFHLDDRILKEQFRTKQQALSRAKELISNDNRIGTY